VAGGLEQLFMVLPRQVGRQQPQRGQVHRTFPEPLQEDRELAALPCRLDPVVGGVLGEPQDLPAVREERREPQAQVDPTGVELGQVGDKVHGGRAFVMGQSVELCDQIVVR
jgi:hypothetical protein